MSNPAEEAQQSKQDTSGWRPSFPLAVVLVVSGQAMFVVLDTAIGYMQNKRQWSSEELLGTRMIGTLCITLASLRYRQIEHVPLGPPVIRKWLLIRGCVCVISIWSGYRCMWYLTTSEFMTMITLNPLVTALLCYVGLGEPFSTRQLVACVVSILAVSMVAFPQAFGAHPPVVDDGLPPPSDLVSRFLGFGIGTLCLLFSALDFFCLRRISDQADPEQVLTTYAFCGTLFCGLWMFCAGTVPVTPSSAVEVAVLLLLILAGYGAQLTVTMGCRTLRGATAAMLGYSGVVWASVNQTVLYGNVPSGPAMIGMGVIVVAGLLGNMASESDQQSTERSEGAVDARGEAEEGDGVPLMDDTPAASERV